MTINFNDVTDTATPTSGTFNTGGNANIRGSGTNLVLYSQDYTQAQWTKIDVTATASGAIAPNSTSTAITVLETTANSVHAFFPTLGLTTSSGALYTISVYVKANGRNFCAVYEGSSGRGKFFNITAGGGGSVLGNLIAAPVSASLVYVGNDWYRVSIVVTAGTVISTAVYLSTDGTTFSYTGNASLGIFAWGMQLELGSTANTYVPTTTAAIYGTPTLSLSEVAGLGLQSDGSLYVRPAGTGALQAQPTTSTITGGNARGQNAVDFQTAREAASRVASGVYTFLGGGYSNASTGALSALAGGQYNTTSGTLSAMAGGYGNTASGYFSGIVSGTNNTAAGFLNFVGAGQSNSGTSASAVTTQSATMNSTTAVTLSGSNANIKVGQLVSGTFLGFPNYVAAISGTSLTLSSAATGSGTATLTFYTPHGVVVGGGNNQATGSYSFIGGGGDAGTAGNRNIASGDWSFVGGGVANQATGLGAVVVGGGWFAAGSLFSNAASGIGAAVLAGSGNFATGDRCAVLTGYGNGASAISSLVGGGFQSIASGQYSTALNGHQVTTRGIYGSTIVGGRSGFGSGGGQAGILVLTKQTTDATATVLVSDISAAGTTNQVILPNNAAYFFKGSCIANVTGAANGAAWSFEGAIMRGANAASTVLIDTPSINRVAASAGATAWTIALTADTTNGGLAVTVTGVAATTIRWVAKVETTEVTF